MIIKVHIYPISGKQLNENTSKNDDRSEGMNYKALQDKKLTVTEVTSAQSLEEVTLPLS